MIGRWLKALRARRDARTIARRPIPDALWRRTLRRFPFLARLDPPRRQRLRELATLFLARKEFGGPMRVRDDMAVAIAAQACLPILELGLEWYDGFVGIVVHRDAVQVRREITDAAGIVHEYDETLAGEAMRGGPVMLAWRDVAAGGRSAAWGYNVVIHEFAHVIDFRAGLTRDAPPGSAAHARWLAALEAAWATFRHRVEAGDDDGFLDPYGAEGLDEFFAVASEAFFVGPETLKAEEPQLYELLARFYRQDPAAAAAPAELEPK